MKASRRGRDEECGRRVPSWWNHAFYVKKAIDSKVLAIRKT